VRQRYLQNTDVKLLVALIDAGLLPGWSYWYSWNCSLPFVSYLDWLIWGPRGYGLLGHGFTTGGEAVAMRKLQGACEIRDWKVLQLGDAMWSVAGCTPTPLNIESGQTLDSMRWRSLAKAVLLAADKTGRARVEFVWRKYSERLYYCCIEDSVVGFVELPLLSWPLVHPRGYWVWHDKTSRTKGCSPTCDLAMEIVEDSLADTRYRPATQTGCGRLTERG
jgi:hypothetical protein